MSTELSTALSEYLAYPFESDENFKKGLSDIVSLGTNTHIPQDAIRSMRVFYFNRMTGHTLSVEEVQAHEHNSAPKTSSDYPTDSTSGASATAESDNVLSFAQIKALIEAGKTDEVPNNKTIPSELNAAPPSTPSLPSRKKPWEV